MVFHFKQFDLEHDRSTLKIGTDAVLLAALTDGVPAEKVLDIGCGCGVITFCIAQKLLQYNCNPTFYGIDIDKDSILEATDNAHNFKLVSCENFLFDNVSLQDFTKQCAPKSFDLIVSNPPYFHNDLKPENKKRRQSKHGDGQLSFGELIENVDYLLNDNGIFSVILPRTESQEFLDMIGNRELYCYKSTNVCPTSKKAIHRVVMQFSRRKGSVVTQSFSIRDADNNYTAEYLDLVKPFLLV